MKMMTENAEKSEREIFREVTAALANPDLSKTALEAVFYEGLSANKRNQNYGTDHNLGLLAARIGHKKAALAFAADHFDIPEFYSSFVICCNFIENNPDRDVTEFWDILEKLCKAGHFISIRYVATQKWHSRPLLKGLSSFLFSLMQLPEILKVARLDTENPRLDNRPAQRVGQ